MSLISGDSLWLTYKIDRTKFCSKRMWDETKFFSGTTNRFTFHKWSKIKFLLHKKKCFKYILRIHVFIRFITVFFFWNILYRNVIYISLNSVISLVQYIWTLRWYLQTAAVTIIENNLTLPRLLNALTKLSTKILRH